MNNFKQKLVMADQVKNLLGMMHITSVSCVKGNNGSFMACFENGGYVIFGNGWEKSDACRVADILCTSHSEAELALLHQLETFNSEIRRECWEYILDESVEEDEHDWYEEDDCYICDAYDYDSDEKERYYNRY